MFVARGVVFQKSVFLRNVSGSTVYLEGVQGTPGLDPPSTEKSAKYAKSCAVSYSYELVV